MVREKFGFKSVILLAMTVLLVTGISQAQDENNNKGEIFAGYSWLRPGGSVAQTPLSTGSPSTSLTRDLPDINAGWDVDGTFKFKRWFGVKGDVGGHYSDPANIYTVMGGPAVFANIGQMTLFGEALGGLSHISPSGLSSGNGVAAAAGGGVEVWLTRRFAWRVVQCDYVYQGQSTSDIGRRGTFKGERVQTGLVFGFGNREHPMAPTASCSVQPAAVMVGEPLTATAAGSHFNPKHTVTYSWSGQGVSGKGATASIDTTNLAPGDYTLTAKLVDPKEHNNNEADCTAQFTVKPLPPKNPPTISCSATPSSVLPGAPVTVECVCTSPDGVAVSVADWTSTGGSVAGQGSTGSVSTAGIEPGQITIGATCTDARGLKTQSSTQVTIQAPPVVNKELEARLALHSVYFPTAQPTVANPNAGLVPSQEQTLLKLSADFKEFIQNKPDARLTLYGHADVRGSVEYNQALSERRVARVKSFLVENGVPEASIDTQALGDQHNLSEADVKASVERNTELSPEERAKVLQNIKTIIWASNRRVDITLNSAGQTEKSVREYPFNAKDSLTLISDREAAAKKHPVAKKHTKKKE